MDSWPIAPDQIVPFLLAMLIIELTPGPNMGYLALVAVQRGKRAGLIVVAGVTVGLLIYMIAAVAGIAEVIVQWPQLYSILRWGGFLYLLYLAAEIWLQKAGVKPEQPVSHSEGRALFWRGVLVNVLNPKAALFYLTLLPGFIDPSRGGVAVQALSLGLCHIAISIGVHCTIVIGAGHTRLTTMKSAAVARLLRHGFAAALVLIALWLLWATRGAPVILR